MSSLENRYTKHGFYSNLLQWKDSLCIRELPLRAKTAEQRLEFAAENLLQRILRARRRRQSHEALHKVR